MLIGQRNELHVARGIGGDREENSLQNVHSIEREVLSDAPSFPWAKLVRILQSREPQCDCTRADNPRLCRWSVWVSQGTLSPRQTRHQHTGACVEDTKT